MDKHHVVLNGIDFDLQRLTDIQLDSLRQSFPDNLALDTEWITRQAGPIELSSTMPTADTFNSNPQNWTRSPRMELQESENFIEARSETAAIASLLPQVGIGGENSTEIRTPSIEASSTSSSATAGTPTFQITQSPIGLSNQSHSASAQMTPLAESLRPMRYPSSEDADVGTGALQSTSHATMAQSFLRPSSLDWNDSETKHEDPIQTSSYRFSSLGFLNATYPQWVIAHLRTHVRRHSRGLTPFEDSTGSELADAESQQFINRPRTISDASTNSSSYSDCSLRYLLPFPERNEENESDGDGSAFGDRLHRISARSEEVASTNFGSQTPWIRAFAAQNQMFHILRANLPVLDPEIEDSSREAEYEDSGDENEEPLVLDYSVVEEIRDVTSSGRRNLRRWNGKERRGSRCPSFRSKRNALRPWNGRARRGSSFPPLNIRESEDEIENVVEVESLVKVKSSKEPEEKIEAKRKRRWGVLGKVNEWRKKFFKLQRTQ